MRWNITQSKADILSFRSRYVSFHSDSIRKNGSSSRNGRKSSVLRGTRIFRPPCIHSLCSSPLTLPLGSLSRFLFAHSALHSHSTLLSAHCTPALFTPLSVPLSVLLTPLCTPPCASLLSLPLPVPHSSLYPSLFSSLYHSTLTVSGSFPVNSGCSTRTEIGQSFRVLHFYLGFDS
jgi:hypothetical protein